MKSINIVLCSC